MAGVVKTVEPESVIYELDTETCIFDVTSEIGNSPDTIPNWTPWTRYAAAVITSYLLAVLVVVLPVFCTEYDDTRSASI